VRPLNSLFVVIAGMLVVSLAINVALHLTARTGVETVWFHDGQFLRGVQGADSWKSMEAARSYTRSHASGLYQQVFFNDAVKFQYPPTALLLFHTMERPTLKLISWLATLLTAALVAVILRRSIAAVWGEEAPRPAVAIALDALVVVAALTFYPVMKAYSLGQIQSWLNLLFAAAMLAWMTGARGVAGAALGLMCLIKPTYALLFVWGAVRQQWRFVASGAAVMASGLALSLWRFGLHDHVEYLRVLSYIARRGEAFYPNQSINGVLNRLFFNGSNLEWRYHEFPPVHPLVYAGTMAAFVVLGAAALRRPERGAGTVVDFSIAALAVTLTAPIAWEHHYGILLPIYAAVTPFVIAHGPLGRWTAAAMAASYIVAANYFQFTNRFADTWLNPLQSYLLGAAILLWGLMYGAAHARRQEDRQRYPIHLPRLRAGSSSSSSFTTLS
jgi:alpha-1,2-mannosyltransferase